jgi:hypothetical protein
MASWHMVRTLAPELAPRVQARFEQDGHAILGTLHRDGSPRLTGIELSFLFDELWLGMMPDSLKAYDLLRDPRCALHCITHGKEVRDGDAKLGALARAETNPEQVSAVAAALSIPEEMLPMALFRLDVQDMSFLEAAGSGDHLVITSWRDGEPVRERKRY